jgi:tetratricopeptide (TPR) repeat protein
MLKRRMAMIVVLGLAAATAHGAMMDTIRTIKEEKGVKGHIMNMSAKEIEIEVGGSGGIAKQIPVNQILGVAYGDEPAGLRDAHTQAKNGEFEKARELLDGIAEDQGKRPEIAQEIEFLKAYCSGQQGLGGAVDPVDAAKQVFAFIKNNPNSYHYYEACELEGNLLVAAGLFDKATDFFTRLSAAPWPDFKLRANVAMGRALLAQNKMAEASKSFDLVLASDVLTDLADAQKLIAKVGKARCLIASKPEDAIPMIEDIIKKADAEQTELHALAYNALGTALRKTGKQKEALLAFLHVDLLYDSYPDAHAEALANMAELFKELHKQDRAAQTRKRLEEEYHNSRWTAGVR